MECCSVRDGQKRKDAWVHEDVLGEKNIGKYFRMAYHITLLYMVSQHKFHRVGIEIVLSL